MITLSYPAGVESPTLSVTLRSPNLNEPDQLNLNPTFGMTMDGSVSSYRKVTTSRKLLMTFLAIRDLTALKNFLDETNGEEIQMIDWLDRVWRGYILNNPLEYVSVHTNNHSVTLEFEGVVISPSGSST